MSISFFKKSVFFSLLTSCFILYWRASMGHYMCTGDCLQYIALMGKSIFSLEYWQTFIRMYRPFTIPMFYSFFGNFSSAHQQLIVYFQTTLAFLAWLTFAYSLSSLVKNKSLKIIIFYVILLSMFGRSTYIFNMHLLSDSIALSLLLLWYSFIIHLPKIKKSAFLFLFFTLFTFILASTRDTQVFMILFAAPLFLNMPLPRYEKILFITIIFYMSVACQLNAVHRHRTNMLNIITGVILSDPEKRDFFVKRGMPVDEKLFSDPEVVKHWDFTTLRFAPIHKANEKVEKVLLDFLGKAQGIYAHYLLTHPTYVLENLERYYRLILDQSYIDQTGDFTLAKLSLMDNIRSDKLILIVLLSLLIYYTLPSTARQEKNFLFYAAIFILAGLTNAVIAFHGDFWALAEMQRHTLIGSIFLKLGCISLLVGTLLETGLFLLTSHSKHKKQIY